MKIIYMGTPEFAVPGLRAISESGHRITGVVTGCDKPAGRGQTVCETPIKQLARQLGLPILQPPSLKAPEFQEQILSMQADIIVVVAFRILPDEVIRAARLGAINLHASLLPQYRGAAPINWAIINGEKETGITVFQITPQIDTGDILFQERVAIGEQETYGELYTRLAQLGGAALVEVLNRLESGVFSSIPQDDLQATRAPKIHAETGRIDWSRDAGAIRHLIHGLSPAPGAFSFFNSKRIKFLRAQCTADNTTETPGTIVATGKSRLGIQTGSGILFPLELQAEGKKALPIAEFLRGFQGKIGDSFRS